MSYIEYALGNAGLGEDLCGLTWIFLGAGWPSN